MAVRRGLFVQPTAGGVGTTPTDARINLAGLLTPNGALGVAPGILSGLTVTGVASGWTYQVSAGHAVTTRGATDGAILVSVDGNTNTPTPVLADGSPGSTSAPVSGSRWELIWILQRDLDAAEADNIAAIGVTQGVASGSPVRPVVPNGALVLWEALVPTGAANTAAGSVTITRVAPQVGVRGGILAVNNSAQRDFLNTYASATSPVYVHRLDTNTVEFSVASGTWRPLRTASWSRLDTTNAAVPTITQWGIIRIAGAGTTSITGALTFPEAFAASLPPHVSTNVMGYRATGAYNPNGLTSTGIESWVSKAYAVSNSAASILVASSVAIAAGFDIYVSWSATGQAA